MSVENILAGKVKKESGLNPLERLNRHFASRELVTMGTFAALIQIASMVVALMGGGMNPLSLVLKNIIFTTLLMVLLTKIAKKGTLCLFGLISSLFSLIAMGSGAILLFPKLLSAVFAEVLINLMGGYKKRAAVVCGVLMFELLTKALALGISWFSMREEPAMLIGVSIFVVIGFLGTLIGLATGTIFIRELRHAGLIRQ